MRRIPLCITLAAALTTIVAACGDDTTNPATGGAGGGGNGGAACDVRVVDFRFMPDTLVIAAGDSVTWCFEGSAFHTVTEGATLGGTPMFNSGLMNTGTFGYRFTMPGTVPYHCIPHFSIGMRGVVIVQ